MKTPKILFFVRGLGLGHATRDLTIAKQISEMDNDVELKFVSCAAGARFLGGNSYPLIDTGLPAMGKDGERVAKYVALIKEEKPDIIVTDEELPVIPLAAGSGIPCALITNWFQADNPEIVDIFSHATLIIVPDYKEGFHMDLYLYCKYAILFPEDGFHFTPKFVLNFLTKNLKFCVFKIDASKKRRTKK